MTRIWSEDKLAKCPDEQLGVRIPIPLRRKIEELRQRVEAAGTPGTVPHKELVAALLFDATEGGGPKADELVAMLNRYRNAKAKSRMPKGTSKVGYFDYEAPRAGRPARR